MEEKGVILGFRVRNGVAGKWLRNYYGGAIWREPSEADNAGTDYGGSLK